MLLFPICILLLSSSGYNQPPTDSKSFLAWYDHNFQERLNKTVICCIPIWVFPPKYFCLSLSAFIYLWLKLPKLKGKGRRETIRVAAISSCSGIHTQYNNQVSSSFGVWTQSLNEEPSLHPWDFWMRWSNSSVCTFSSFCAAHRRWRTSKGSSLYKYISFSL